MVCYRMLITACELWQLQLHCKFSSGLFGPVPILHYLCAPTRCAWLQGASDILNHDELQTKELFTDMVKQGDANCLSDNRWSAVQCPLAKRDPKLAQGPKKSAPAAAAEEKPMSAIATAIKDAAAGDSPLLPTAAPKAYSALTCLSPLLLPEYETL